MAEQGKEGGTEVAEMGKKTCAVGLGLGSRKT